MSLKKKLGLGMASAALGLALVGGGTFAYFNDVETANSTFAAGTLDLAVNPTTIIDVNNLKPGDTMFRTFKLENKGSLDIKDVILQTSYTETVAGFGDHIRVNFLINEDKGIILDPSNVIVSKTLSELTSMEPDAVENLSKTIWGQILGERDGLKAGTKDDLYVQFEFVDNDEDQNAYQGASLSLEWTFTANQTAGQAR